MNNQKFCFTMCISGLDVLVLDHPKCLDLIFIYLSGLLISNKRQSEVVVELTTICNHRIYSILD